MVKESNKHLILLFALFVFSFLYRFLLMTRGAFPSGADIGLHNSVIHSITQGGNVDFLYNYYQMGGGLSLTFPGYHIFAAQIMLLTGMPEYLVHAVIVSLVSSVVVLAAFLITKSVWRESAAFIVAFLVAISRFDIEMLLWGGYPNVITLLLIPVTFYMYLAKNRFTKIPFYISTSLLVASIFLAHSLSSLVFVSILISVIFLGVVLGQKIKANRREMLSWLLPVVLGAVIVSPFLVQVVPAYLANATPSAINEATASTRILPYEIVVPLFVIVSLFFLLSKKYSKHYFTVPTLMIALWLLIPLIFTQSYLIELYTDYNRYLYFVIMPVCFLVGVFIDLGSGFFARVIVTYRTLTSQLNTGAKEVKQVTHKRLAKIQNKISRGMTRKNIYSGFVLGLLIVCFAAVPIFMPPTTGIQIQTFYQRMNPQLMEAMDWARTNTPTDATFVTEAYYGWWFGGFAQRPTWSAVDPQYLMLGRELPVAMNASYLLDTDYVFETNFTLPDNQNATIQVREDGGYLARHNPEILTKLNWTYFPYSFFNFNSADAEIAYSINGDIENLTYVYLNELIVKDMHMENDSQHVTVSITRGNKYFDCVQTTTVNQGSRFVTLTTKFYNNTESVIFSRLLTTLEASAEPIASRTNTIGFFAEGVKAFGQIIFNKNIPGFPSLEKMSDDYQEKGSADIVLRFPFDNASRAELEMSVTTYSVTDKQDLYSNEDAKNAFFAKQIDSNLQPETPSNLPLPAPFNYRAELRANGLDYIVIPKYYEIACQAAMRLKFANDPMFNLVFINNEVAIFEVKSNIAT